MENFIYEEKVVGGQTEIGRGEAVEGRDVNTSS